MMKVVVLMGGMSQERDISLKGGKAVSAALARQGYEVVDIDAGLDLPQRLAAVRPDAAFIVLHGRYGEDGSVQGLLEIMGIPYTGSGVTASAIGMNKILTKRVVAATGVRVAADLVWTKGDDIDTTCRAWAHGFPAIVKPSHEGSSLGLSLVTSTAEMKKGLEGAARLDDEVVLEAYVKGREMTVGLLDGNSLPTLEVIPASGLYDFKAKYTKGETEYKVPAEIPAAANAALQEASKKVWKALGLSGFARADYILPADNAPVFLEINTIPGFTELSLVPKAAASIGINFDQLVVKILKLATLKIKGKY